MTDAKLFVWVETCDYMAIQMEKHLSHSSYFVADWWEIAADVQRLFAAG